MNITDILERAPAKISQHCEEENKHYAEMIKLHEEYKRLRAKKYLEMKAKSPQEKQKNAEYILDCNKELCNIKDLELREEIDYRASRQRKENAEHYLQVGLEMGRTKRAEIRGLTDDIRKGGI